MLNNEYLSAIKEMAMVDQDLRNMCKPGPHKEPANYMVYLGDQVHNHRIQRLVERFGYPTTDKVGKEGMEEFWIVIQHQDGDVALQENCLKECDFGGRDKAFLTDRIRLVKGEPQVYGTQFHRNAEGKRVTYPIEDAANVDARREKAGLEPLAEYVKSQEHRV